MQIRRFEAANVKDALMQIKREMGPDAIVISTKRLSKGAGHIEVLAAKDNALSPEEMTPSSGAFSAEAVGIKALVHRLVGGEIANALQEINDGIGTILDSLAPGNSAKGSNDLSRRIYYYLLGRGISKRGALGVLSEFGRIATDTMDFEQALGIAEGILRDRFLKDPGDNARLKVLIGPTGSGKTTTVAKLAARYALEQNRSVGLITTDTYRIGGATQLKTYAEIMGLPFEIADEKKAFRRAMERLQDREYIFIDTPGRGPKGMDELFKLKEMLSGKEEVETSLLLNLTASRDNMLAVLDRFGEFGYDKLIVTKMDECSRSGVLCDLAERFKKPVSYVTTGQEVPDDILRASPERLASLILRSSPESPAAFFGHRVR